MVLFVILGVVVAVTFVVLGVLFFMLSKEGQKKDEEAKAVPLTDLSQLKKEFSSQLLEPQKPKVSKIESEIIPPFIPKIELPVQSAQSILEDSNYKKRAEELEAELQEINTKAEGQSTQAQQMIETLTRENEELKSQKTGLEEAQQKLIELRGEASDLKTDNTNLQTQLEASATQVHLLEEQMAAFKVKMGEEISRANEMVFELNREKEALLSAPKGEAEGALRQELEALKSEQVQLNEKYGQLEKANQELHQTNAQLKEKNEALQYELIKARAQSSGLERVSFNYKNQLEDFFKKVNAVQVSNEQLSQVKNRLEGMVEEVKLQNEQLLKKDQLAQFELEKNRSRLVSLERDYEDLKVRTNQKDAQA